MCHAFMSQFYLYYYFTCTPSAHPQSSSPVYLLHTFTHLDDRLFFAMQDFPVFLLLDLPVPTSATALSTSQKIKTLQIDSVDHCAALGLESHPSNLHSTFILRPRSPVRWRSAKQQKYLCWV